MKKIILSTLTLAMLVFILTPSFAQKVNQLTKKEKKQGWVLLFNGEDFDGWRRCNGDEMPVNWEIEDDAMKVLLGARKKPGQG